MAAGTEHLPPAITLTDPSNCEGALSPAQSPSKETYFNAELLARVTPGRPGTPSRTGSANARPDSSSNWASPGRLIRRLSGSAPQAVGGAQKDDASSMELPTAIDPLSQHILNRTHSTLSNHPSISPQPWAHDNIDGSRDERPLSSQVPAPAVQEPLSRTTSTGEAAHKELRKGVKAVSFLTRLMGSKKRNDADDEIADDESSTGEARPEGNDAEVFAQPMDNMGFQPSHPEPPKYIKVGAKFKKERDFDRLFLAQELCGNRRSKLEKRDMSNRIRRKSSAQPSDNTIWAMEFSRDGKYLAAAGADMIVRVWSVLSSLDDRQQHERQESHDNMAGGGGAHSEHASAPVFQSKPLREYDGHTATVLDLSWSKNNFLLSSSMDKTVKLWHTSRAECLCTFKHNDFVPSVSFHPKDDRFFLAGSLDSKLRLWSIPDKNVAYAVQVPDLITAVAFTPCGKWAIAGCSSGLCTFYETEGMKYQSQIHVRSSRGQNAKGSKITGIHAQYGHANEIKVLITSNDSRIRLYNFRDKSLELKFKGSTNTCSQIRASLSDNGRFVVCGSEDRKAYIWSMNQPQGEKRDKTPVEMFEACDTITTAVCFAPMKTRQHLSRSEDPIYDLCNPPPITLLSRAERSDSNSQPPTENGSIQTTPADAEGKFDKAKESPAYLSRCVHDDGNIIVTADYAGRIKVFRQDCAWSKRRQDDWDKASIFTRRSGKVSRTASLATKASKRSLTDKRNSTSTQGPSDRINSWRQGIASYPGVRNGSPKVTGKNRSISPRKSLDQRSRRTADTKNGSVESGSVKSTNTMAHPLAADVMVSSPDALDQDPMEKTKFTQAHGDGTVDDAPQDDPDHTFELHNESNPLAIINGQSYTYWDMENIKMRKETMQRMHENNLAMPLSPATTLTPIVSRSGDESAAENTGEDVRDERDGHLAVRPSFRQADTMVSELSDERSSVDEYDDAREDYWHDEQDRSNEHSDHHRHHHNHNHSHNEHEHEHGHGHGHEHGHGHGGGHGHGSGGFRRQGSVY